MTAFEYQSEAFAEMERKLEASNALVSRLRKQVADANARASKSDYYQMNSIENEEVCGEALAENEKLRARLDELERRFDLPALIREASEVYGQELKLHQHSDGSGSLRPYGDSVHRVVAWQDFNQAQPIIDFIERNKPKPQRPLSEQLHHGARVRMRNGDECVIRQTQDRGIPWVWQCVATWWDKDGRYSPFVGESDFDIVEVLS